MTGWRAWAADRCDEIGRDGRWRSVRDFDARGPRGVLGSGRHVVSFASNDYLGLSAHPDVIAAAHAALDRWGAGSGAARLIVGSRPIHSELEAEIAAWKRTEAALLFPTGFAANLGVLATFGDAGGVILSDELNHASIVDGCRSARARVEIYPHGDVDYVRRALERSPRALVVTDAVFSMDGDVAPVSDLAAACARHGALLVVDEAHSVLSREPDFDGADVLRVGTLSKFLGAFGGFVAGPAACIELLINRARPFIFTTAASPADTAAALAALRIVRSPEGAALAERLRRAVDRLRPNHPSPIVSVVVGDEVSAMAASASLLDAGFLVPAIRPPSVPPGTARLRVTLSAAHTDEEVDALREALAQLVGADA